MDTTPSSASAPAYVYTGDTYLLAQTPDEYTIWDRRAMIQPVESFPKSAAGWQQAWAKYAELEPNRAEVREGRVLPYGGLPVTGLATAALVCGLLGFLFSPFAIAALICGSIARGKIDRGEADPKNRGQATAGLILGAVIVGIWIMVLAVAIISAASGSY